MDIKFAKMCQECAGNGGGHSDESDGEGHIQRGVGVWENCQNCGGTGFEPDEEIVVERIIENLTTEQENKLKDEHAKNYIGTDDDMPDAFENWLMGRELSDLELILK